MASNLTLFLLTLVFLRVRGKNEENTITIQKIVTDYDEFYGNSNELQDHHTVSDEAATNLEILLQQLIETGYDPQFRPHYGGRPVFVTCSVYIGGISSVSETNMDYTIDFYFRQSWDDYRLQWNTTDKDKVSVSEDSAALIWMPDSFFPNEKFSKTFEVTRKNSFVRLFPHGHVQVSTRIKSTVYCPMDLRYFPLDHQKCSLYIESFSHPYRDLVYNWREDFQPSRNFNSLGFDEDVSSVTQFRLSGFKLDKTIKLRHDGFNHSRLVIETFFRRNIGFYLIQVYLPACLMVFSSWIGFWLPRNSSPARITLGVTTVLTIVTLQGQSHLSLPKISYLKAIDIYLLVCFTIVFLCLLEFAIVSYTTRTLKKMNARLHPHPHPFIDDPNYEAADDEELNQALRSALVFKTRTIHLEFLRQHNNQLWYLRLPANVETFSRFLFPLIFIVFNLIYWYFVFILHHDGSEESEGFIPVGNHGHGENAFFTE